MMESLVCPDNDYAALFSLCLFYAMLHNKSETRSTLTLRPPYMCFISLIVAGISRELLESMALPLSDATNKSDYNVYFMDALLSIMCQCCKKGKNIITYRSVQVRLFMFCAYRERRSSGDARAQHQTCSLHGADSWSEFLEWPTLRCCGGCTRRSHASIAKLLQGMGEGKGSSYFMSHN